MSLLEVYGPKQACRASNVRNGWKEDISGSTPRKLAAYDERSAFDGPSTLANDRPELTNCAEAFADLLAQLG